MNRDAVFDKFYKEGEYDKWDPDSKYMSRKTVLRALWGKAWVEGYKEGKGELAAKLCRDLHLHMGNKVVTILE